MTTTLIKNTWPTQAQCDAYYGDPRGGHGTYSPRWAANNLTHVHVPWVCHCEKIPVTHITIHKKCAESLTRVLAYIWEQCGEHQSAIDTLHYHIFDGSFVFRPMRGGHALSMHSYGVAIDFDADENEFGHKVHAFHPDSLIVQAFEGEGWVWGGRWSFPDAMHFQASRVYGAPLDF
jgi:hypothetical protein